MLLKKKRPLGKAKPDGRILTQRVYQHLRDLGYTKCHIAEVVETVLSAWKQALQRGESVEVPLGVLKVTKSPRERRGIMGHLNGSEPTILKYYVRPKMIRYAPNVKDVNKELN